MQLRSVIPFFIAMMASIPAYSENLDFAFGDYQNAPYVYIDENENMTKGIMFDISQNLAQRLPFKIVNIQLPRKRTEEFLKSGKVDVRCHLSPEWVEVPSDFDWTAPLYELNTIVITPKNTSEPIVALEGLKDKVIGTVRGYRYSDELTEFLSNNKAKTLDSNSLESALLMMSKKRVNAVVGNDILTQYLIKKFSLADELVKHPFIVRKQPIHCALSKQSNLDNTVIIKALENMQSEDVFGTILSSYF